MYHLIDQRSKKIFKIFSYWNFDFSEYNVVKRYDGLFAGILDTLLRKKFWKNVQIHWKFFFISQKYINE